MAALPITVAASVLLAGCSSDELTVDYSEVAPYGAVPLAACAALATSADGRVNGPVPQRIVVRFGSVVQDVDLPEVTYDASGTTEIVTDSTRTFSWECRIVVDEHTNKLTAEMLSVTERR